MIYWQDNSHRIGRATDIDSIQNFIESQSNVFGEYDNTSNSVLCYKHTNPIYPPVFLCLLYINSHLLI